MEELKIDYTVGGGANRVERGELVIYSWERLSEPAGFSDEERHEVWSLPPVQ